MDSKHTHTPKKKKKKDFLMQVGTRIKFVKTHNVMHTLWKLSTEIIYWCHVFVKIPWMQGSKIKARVSR